MLKKIFFILAAIIGLAAIYLYVTVYPMIPIGTGYAAKKMCSCHFVADRSQESIQKDDLSRSPLNLTSTVIDETAQPLPFLDWEVKPLFLEKIWVVYYCKVKMIIRYNSTSQNKN